MSASLSDEYAQDGIEYIRIDSDQLSAQSLWPVDPDGVRIPVERATVVRFHPLRPMQHPEIVVQSLTLVGDERTFAVEGTWHLQLATPANLAESLQLEHLAGGTSNQAGISISVVSAVRSTTETRVTVLIDSALPVDVLALPTLLDDGRLLTGGPVEESPDGSRITYRFPRTEFGSDVSLRFGSFVRDEEAEAGTVSIDLASAIVRDSVAPGRGHWTDGPWIEVRQSEADQISGGLELVPFAAVLDARITPIQGRQHALRVAFHGRLDGGATDFIASGADGTQLPYGAKSHGYSRDVAGVLTSPHTEIWLGYDTMDQIDGTITVTFLGGSEARTIEGPWEILLAP
jgi:hypothetical protein